MSATSSNTPFTSDLGRRPVNQHIAADVLQIGYPKAASTFVARYLESHPDVTFDQHRLGDLLVDDEGIPTLVDKPSPHKIHVSRDENVAESVCWISHREVWQKYLYVPDAWDSVKHGVVVDPGEAAMRLHRVHPDAKILMLIREQADWLQSVYKYAISQLRWNRRSFSDYCATPSGVVQLQAGHYDQTIEAYVDLFGSRQVGVLRFEDIIAAPRKFAAELCAFVGISERPLPQRRENETSVQLVRIQRAFPLVEQLPRNVKDALKSRAARLLPGARGSILTPRDIRDLRSHYTVSNQRTEKLLVQLSMQLRSATRLSTSK
jgi:sulfotransferase family protein